MNVGDLVRFDSPNQRNHGKVGLIVNRKLELVYREWETKASKRFTYDVLIEGQVWRCGYEDLLAEEDWVDAAR